MRGLFVLLLLATVGLSSALPGLNLAHANTSSGTSSDIRLLSYAELMQLPRDKRAMYIEGVRAILIDLSKNPNGRFSDSDIAGQTKLKAWLRWLDGQVDEAKAQKDVPRCFWNKACRKALAVCFDKRQGLAWDATVNAYTCDPAIPIVLKKDDKEGHEKLSEKFYLGKLEVKTPNPRFAPTAAGPIVIDSTPLPESVAPVTSATTARMMASEPQISSLKEFAVKNATRYGCRSATQDISTKETASLDICDARVEAKIESDFKAQNPVAAGLASVAKANAAAEDAANKKPIAPPVSNLPAPSATRSFSMASDQNLQMSVAPKPIAIQNSSVSSTSSTTSVSSTTPEPSTAPVVSVQVNVVADTNDVTTAPVIPPTVVDLPPKSERSREILAEEIKAYLDRKENPNKICIEEAKANGASAMDLVTTADGTHYCMTAKGEEEYRRSVAASEAKKSKRSSSTVKATRGAASALAKSTAKSEAKNGTTEATKTATSAPVAKYTCAPKPDVCEDPATSRAKVFQGNLSCVFAGMVSKFDSKNRKCTAVTEFKLGDASYKCDSGQTMCNPFLFGTVSSTKPICVGRGNDVTAQCSKLSTSRDAEIFLNRNEAGLQNRWDEFRDAFANVCKPGTIQVKFHCNECNIMKTRLFELEARLVGDPCKEGVTADSAVKARIKARGTSTSK